MSSTSKRSLIFSIFTLAIVTACGGAPDASTETATLVGQVDLARLPGTTSLEAISDRSQVYGLLDKQGRFEIKLEPDVGYQLWLDGARRAQIDLGPSPIEQLILQEQERLDLGLITLSVGEIISGEPQSDDQGEPTGEPVNEPNCEVDLRDCEFTTYNLDVEVGDRFVLSNFLSECHGQIGIDLRFEYEDQEAWNLEAFNTNQVIEIDQADLEGGNHGNGEYRFMMVTSEGEELDHMTIRIEHGDSDIEKEHTQAPPVHCASRNDSDLDL